MRKIIVSIMILIGLSLWLGSAGLIAALPLCLIGMAKVSGPLFSLEARGKVADAVVYFPWKGLHVVRQWLKPSNPQSNDQGNRRVMLGGLGRAPKYIQADTIYYNHAVAVAVAPNTWISTFVKHIMTEYFPDVAGFDALNAELIATGISADYGGRALALGLVAFDLDYKSMDNTFGAALQLYCLAKFGCDQYLLNNEKFNTEPYTKPLATWDDSDIVKMVADFSPV